VVAATFGMCQRLSRLKCSGAGCDNEWVGWWTSNNQYKHNTSLRFGETTSGGMLCIPLCHAFLYATHSLMPCIPLCHAFLYATHSLMPCIAPRNPPSDHAPFLGRSP
jgi:hypothetical protein